MRLKFNLNLPSLLSYLNHPTTTLLRTQQIHSILITTSLLSSSPLPTTSLISSYSHHHHLPSLSLSTFLSSPHSPNLFHFNSLISSLSPSLPLLSLHFFSLHRRTYSLRPDNFSFPPTINATTSPFTLFSLHADAFKLCFAVDKFTATSLTTAYVRLGLFEHARKLFDELPVRDVVMWNAMITGFARKGEFELALGYVGERGREGVMASGFTVTGVLSVFTARGDGWGGRMAHGFAVKVGLGKELGVGNALVDFYGKVYEVTEAERVFEEMERRDLVSWNTMASMFRYNAEHGETVRLVARMRRCGVMPDGITIAAVLPACSQVVNTLNLHLLSSIG